MTTITAFVKRHPVLAFYALVFAISWGGVLLVIGGPGALPGTKAEFERLVPVAVLAMIAGPSVAGILLTGLVHGRAGLREYRARLLRWRVGARWYAVALLTAPLLMMAMLLALSRVSPEFVPGILTTDDKVGLVLFGMAVALAAGVVEELGWTGFAIPTLRQRYGVLTTGIIVGLLWAAWHWLVAFWASGTVSGALALTSYLLDPLLYLVAFRVLMVWVYDRTESLPIAMLMHMSLTASPRILGAPGLAGVPLLTFDVLWFAAVSAIVAAVARSTRRQRSRQSLRTRAA